MTRIVGRPILRGALFALGLGIGGLAAARPVQAGAPLGSTTPPALSGRSLPPSRGLAEIPQVSPSTTAALAGVGGLILLAPYLRRKTRSLV